MSISLIIEYNDGTFRDIPVGTHARIKDGWAPLARSIGLVNISDIYSFVPVDHENIGCLISELTCLQAEMEQRGDDWVIEAKRIGELINELCVLQSTKGWAASIG